MFRLLQLVSWLWNRVTGDDDDGADESGGQVYSRLDASVNLAHGHPHSDGVRALKRANERANVLEEHGGNR